MNLTLAEYRERARRRLPHGIFEYVDRGTENETALSAIRAGLDSIRLCPRVLAGPASADLKVTVLGRELGMPVIIAPTAFAGLVSFNGELKLARAAQNARIPYCVTTQSITAIEEIRDAAPTADLWFQLYVWKNRQLTRDLLQRAGAAGVDTIAVTVDGPVDSIRTYNDRNGFGLPFGYSPRAVADVALHPGWLLRVIVPYLRRGGLPTYAHYPSAFARSITRPTVEDEVRIERQLSWDDIIELRRFWRGKIVLKGILHPDDAGKAAEIGADGIVVSAHGGRNLDVASTPAEVLPGIAEKFGDKLEIIADTGVRAGTDIIKYMALGAKAVMTGRLPLWGLAADGETGAREVLRTLANEMDINLTNLGIKSVARCRELLVTGGLAA